MKKTARLIALVLIVAMAFTLTGCKSAAAKKTEELISAIGEVTADSKDAVEAAEAAFGALKEKEQAQVENAAALTEAREALDSALRVKGVEDLIEGLGVITADSEAAVEAAEAALRSLPGDEAAQVENAGALATAREQLEEALDEAEKQALLGSWKTEVDVRSAFLTGFMIGIDDLAEYLPRPAGDYFPSVIIPVVLTLKDDGTFTLEPAEGWEDRLVGDLAPNLRTLLAEMLTNYLPAVLAGSGMNVNFSTPDELDAFLNTYLGMDLDEVIESSVGTDLASFMRETLRDAGIADSARTTGTFEILPREDHILLALDSEKAEPDEAVFDVYELSGDTLVLRAGSGDVLILYSGAVYEGVDDLPEELTFSRAA